MKTRRINSTQHRNLEEAVDTFLTVMKPALEQLETAFRENQGPEHMAMMKAVQTFLHGNTENDLDMNLLFHGTEMLVIQGTCLLMVACLLLFFYFHWQQHWKWVPAVIGWGGLYGWFYWRAEVAAAYPHGLLLHPLPMAIAGVWLASLAHLRLANYSLNESVC